MMTIGLTPLLWTILTLIGLAIGVSIVWFVDNRPKRPRVRRITKKSFDRVDRRRRTL